MSPFLKEPSWDALIILLRKQHSMIRDHPSTAFISAPLGANAAPTALTCVPDPPMALAQTPLRALFDSRE